MVTFNRVAVVEEVIFPSGSDGKETACNVGDPCLTPGSGRSPGERNGNSLEKKWQYFCPGEKNGSILAWKIQWKEEPGRPQFMILQRV